MKRKTTEGKDNNMIQDEEKIQNNTQGNCGIDDEKITILLDDENNSQSAEFEKQKRLNGELVGDLRKLKAEFENYRRRSDIQSRNARSEGNYEVIEKLLPLMDAFENAEKLISDKKILEGVKLISKQLEDVLASYSVKKIDALNEEFDPSLHNAVLTKEDAHNSGKVIEVVRTGYTAGDKVLRYAYVVVGQ